MVDPLNYFSFQPVLHDKGRDMCHAVFRMVLIKDPLLLIGKGSPCIGGNGSLFSLYEWYFIICPSPCKRK